MTWSVSAAAPSRHTITSERRLARHRSAEHEDRASPPIKPRRQKLPTRIRGRPPYRLVALRENGHPERPASFLPTQANPRPRPVRAHGWVRRWRMRPDSPRGDQASGRRDTSRQRLGKCEAGARSGPTSATAARQIGLRRLQEVLRPSPPSRRPTACPPSRSMGPNGCASTWHLLADDRAIHPSHRRVGCGSGRPAPCGGAMSTSRPAWCMWPGIVRGKEGPSREGARVPMSDYGPP
jgi:hypothetical protein